MSPVEPKLNYKHVHPPFDWQLNYTWSSEKGSFMSKIIDKTMVLFLKHKGRETQNIFRSVNRAAAAAALTAEQAGFKGLVLFLLDFSCLIREC